MTEPRLSQRTPNSFFQSLSTLSSNLVAISTWFWWILVDWEAWNE